MRQVWTFLVLVVSGTALAVSMYGFDIGPIREWNSWSVAQSPPAWQPLAYAGFFLGVGIVFATVADFLLFRIFRAISRIREMSRRERLMLSFDASLAVLFPLLAWLKLGEYAEMWFIICWSFVCFFYIAAKSSQLGDEIDRRDTIRAKRGKGLILALIPPYLGLLVSLGFWLAQLVHYSFWEWVLWWQNFAAITVASDFLLSFITDFLKASPVADRVERETTPQQR